MSWTLAFLGFAVLIILHEAGHFFAAKAVGMRVERFSLFFPPLIARRKKGETEYAIGAIPLGGYVKITGMNPAEEIQPEHAHRAYYRQPVWKRIVVIGAGPAVNIALAFILLAGVVWYQGTIEPPPRVGEIDKNTPAATVLQPGDAIVAVDGRRFSGGYVEQQTAIGDAIAKHKGTEVAITVDRDGRETVVRGKTYYDRATGVEKYRFGFTYDREASRVDVGPVHASGLAVEEMWRVTSTTVSTIAQIFVPEKREEIGSVVGGYNETRKAFELDTTTAIVILALISLSLGVINLFPFLPLDGGHIFWALAEKVRGRPIPFSVMERAGFVGFALVIMLFFIGVTNDIDRIANGGSQIR